MVRRAGGTISNVESGALCRSFSIGSLRSAHIVEVPCLLNVTSSSMLRTRKGRDALRRLFDIFCRDDSCFPFFLVCGYYLCCHQIEQVLRLRIVESSLVAQKEKRDSFR